MKILLHENIPRWYVLWWDFSEKRLLIKIHRQFLQEMPHKDFTPYFGESVLNRSLDPLFDRYEAVIGKATFGYGDSITQIEADEHWLTYWIKIPRLRHQTGLICPACDGTGCRFFNGKPCENEPCTDCHGTKKEEITNWAGAQKTAHSLSVLLSALEFPLDKETGCREMQLISITASSGGRDHCFLGGQMSPYFIDGLRTLSSNSKDHYHLDKVTKAQVDAWLQMFGRLGYYAENSFNSWVAGGNLMISCPGDACEVHPSPYVQDIRPGYGVELTCHNLDSPHQLLCLISGLGAATSLVM
jgi:hypothetical protein